MGIDTGHIHGEPRFLLNTAPTAIEDFAKATFGPPFNAAPEPGFGDRFGGFFLRSVLFVTGHRAA